MQPATITNIRILVSMVLLTASVTILIHGHMKLSNLELLLRNSTITINSTISIVSPLAMSFNKTREKYFIVFIIPSLPSKTAIRKTIRETWMNISSWNGLLEFDERIKVMFLFGAYVDKERKFSEEFYEEVTAHDDMYIIPNLREQRTALKYKIMWAMQQALYRYDFSYIAKTDDDVVVNLPVMIKDLRTLPKERYYTGNCAIPYGGFGGWPRWKYCSGGGYVLTQDVVRKFQELPGSVHDVPFRPEDAYTGWLVNRVGRLLGYEVTKEPGLHRLRMKYYDCGPLDFWFYHQSKTVQRHIDLHERLKGNRSVMCENK